MSEGESQFKYKIGDRVLAKHGPLLYAAKVEEVDPLKGAFLHYEGWKRKWDEWVSNDRIYEDNETNRKLRDTLKMEQTIKTSRAAERRNSANYNQKRRKDAGDDNDGEEEDVFADSSIRLNLSEELKIYVVRDWENLTQKNMICNLPKSPEKSVSRIFADFLATKKKLSVMTHICDGLSVYFDRALPTILLYRAERPQLETLKEQNPDKRYCEIYGGEHLLRLFVRLPQLLTTTDLDELETKQLCSRLVELLKFLTKHTTTYFGTENDGTYILNSVPPSGAESPN